MSEMANLFPIKQFITIDDDHASLFICRVILQKTFKGVPVLTYSNPYLALDYFKNEFILNPVETVILLDINMPEVSGWDVLVILHLLDTVMKEKINVIMLSSSIDAKDKQQGIEFPLVSAYIEKPLTIARLEEELDKIKAEMTLQLKE